MNTARVVILLAFAFVLATPLAARRWLEIGRPQSSGDGSGPRLIIWTPHVEQIRAEFGAAFERWHRRTHGSAVSIDWRTPGGTTEIVRMLQSQYQAAGLRLIEQAKAADPLALLRADFAPEKLFSPGAVPVDLMFGGGSFDHGRLREPRNCSVLVRTVDQPRTVSANLTLPKDSVDFAALGAFREVTAEAEIEGQKLRLRIPAAALADGPSSLAPLAKDLKGPVRLELSRTERVLQWPMSRPAGFSQAQLDAWFGENRVGAEKLYDPQQYWIGTALSGFGLVYNRDSLKALGLPTPSGFADLTDHRYFGSLAMADPRQSGSVATLYDSVLNKGGWVEGWRVLREMGANARYFGSSSTQPPMDVSQGEAAAGVAIDFYGRGQSQAVLQPGETPETGRLGYVDPPGATYIDADPASIMLGGPNGELAQRFVAFVLSDEGQALWQFPPRSDPASAQAPMVEGTSERMGPVEYRLRRMPVRRSMYERFVGFFVDKTDPFTIASDTKPRGWRDGMIVIYGCMAIDAGEELRAAWAALARARKDQAFPKDRLTEMERLFAAMPVHELRDKEGRVQKLEFNEANYKAISEDTARWRDPVKGTRSRIAYTEFFRATYRRVAELGRDARGG
jgi:ABC-type Fe3+ transport system substrate-binding protein